MFMLVRAFAYALLLLPLTYCTAGAAPVVFGARTIEIPAPENFQALAQRRPQVITMTQAAVPDGVRVVDVYATAAITASLGAGKQPELGRYFVLEVLRSDDGKPETFDQYANNSDFVEAELRRRVENEREQNDQLAAQASQRLHKPFGEIRAALGIGSEFLGVTRKEPWGLFFSLKTKKADGTLTINSIALVDVDYQVPSLLVYAPYRNAADRFWAEQAVLDWAKALRAANPDDPAIAGTLSNSSWTNKLSPEDFERIGRDVGALIGVIAVVVWSSRRKRKK
jgi:hypothetical protein